MSFLVEISEKFAGRIETYSTGIRKKIFGANNEHLDFLMDSFYKLEPQRRNGVLAAGGGIIIGFVFIAIFVYFSQVKSLERELNESFSALRELKMFIAEEKIEDRKFETLVSNVVRKTKGVNFKPFFEKLSQEKHVELKGLNERAMDADASNPLYQKIKETQIDMKIPKVSIPKLLAFLVEIEKSGHYMRIQDLKITGMYGNRLFFETNLLVRGYSTIASSK